MSQTCLTLAHISPALPWSNHGLICQFIIERSYSILAHISFQFSCYHNIYDIFNSEI
ncbi:hypothetical protein F383_30456 [Gossypium arboreum]|uniref:Uncharacterized protein n=1 Tax=Gossypium arboreum TaxID=29729 RepID=A0A0B0PKW1_GOSAR|nr:hypothetical protein F383_30456 [Gossypium arboreum]